MKKLFSLFTAILFAASMMASDIYYLVTDVTTLAAGDAIIITNEDADKAISTTQNNNNRGAADVTAVAGAITPGDDVQVITLEASSSNWKFKVGTDAYLYAASNSNNYLKTSTATTAGDNGVWSITIDAQGVATVVAQGSNGRNNMRYNGDNTLFSCYVGTSAFPKVKIFKLGAPSSDPYISASDVNIGTLYIEGEQTQFENYEISIDVTSGNLTEDINVSLPAVTGLTIVNPSTGVIEMNVPAVLLLHLTAGEGEIDEQVVLISGETTKTIAITGEVKKKSTSSLPGLPATMNTNDETKAAAATVNEADAVKVGTSKVDGSMTITVPAKTVKLHFYAAAWNGGEGTITVSNDDVTLSPESFDLKAESAFNGTSSAFTVSDFSDYRCDVTLSGVTADTNITLSSGTARRFVVWGATYEVATETAISNTAVEGKAVKFIQNGQLFIERDGQVFNVLGQTIR